MEIGKKIKMLRTSKGITQETLAQELNLTPQAVSRWENGLALPDITLLPALSVFFGVRIDDFFELSDDAQFERIDHMLEMETVLSRGDFDSAERFLKDRIALDPRDAKSHRTLAELYNHRADGYRRKAAVLAKRSLELEPREKAGHSILSTAANGDCGDWCEMNHRELIDYYYGFIQKNPDYRPGYLWLLGNLLADNRLAEAQKAVRQMEQLAYSYHVPLYDGYIASLLGDHEQAEAHWRKMLDENPKSWEVWSSMGDMRVRQCRYDEAVTCYQTASAQEDTPGYIHHYDYDSIGQVRELQGSWDEAAAAYEKVLEILRDNWQMTEGVQVEKYKEAVLRCRSRG